MYNTAVYSHISLFKRSRNQAVIKVLISCCFNVKNVKADMQIHQSTLRCQLRPSLDVFLANEKEGQSSASLIPAAFH